MDALAQVEGIDRQRIVTCGHSAGGHLALWAATSRLTARPPSAEPVRVRAAISLAGVVDLVVAARLGLGGGAVQALMGGDPDEYPGRYAQGSPASLLPLGVPQILVHGLEDTTVPASLSAQYVERAVSAGDQATFVPVAGAGHMEMIDPHAAAAAQLVSCLDAIS
jgi:pimeloyl-ACP methyl ester carboxylesterase